MESTLRTWTMHYALARRCFFSRKPSETSWVPHNSVKFWGYLELAQTPQVEGSIAQGCPASDPGHGSGAQAAQVLPAGRT